MKTHYSDTEYAKKAAITHQQSSHVFPPAVAFSKKKKDKDADDDKEKHCKIDVPINPENPDQTTERKVATFEDGDAEDFIEWRIGFDDLATECPLDAADKKLRIMMRE